MALQGMLALPTELLQEIGGYLGDDINSLWMSHRRIYDALSPVVFRCITIDIRRTSLEAGLSMLTLLSMKSAHWAGYVKKLKIKAISPHYPILEKRYAIYGALRYPLVESEDLGWLDLFEREIEEHLGPAICSLENVTEVEWYPTPEDLDSTRKTIIQSLISLPLQSFSIESGKSYPFMEDQQLPFHYLNNLRSFSIRGELDRSLDNLYSVVPNSPQLNTLTIDLRLHPSRSGVSSTPRHKLGDLFTKLPDAFRLPLSQLTLGGVSMEIPSSRGAFLRNLNSLTILDIHTNTSSLWTSLQKIGVKLRKLTCSAVEECLILYLASYVGLEELTLPAVHAQPSISAPEIEERFHTLVLAQHATTLRKVHIVNTFFAPWAFRVRYIPSYSACQELRGLTISAHAIWRESGNNPVRSLLIELLSRLPKLESLRFLVEVNSFGAPPSLSEQREERQNVGRIRKAILSTVFKTKSERFGRRDLKPRILVAEFTYIYSFHEQEGVNMTYRPTILASGTESP